MQKPTLIKTIFFYEVSGKSYLVSATGVHRKNVFTVWVDGQCVLTVTKEYGHINKTAANQILSSYFNGIK